MPALKPFPYEHVVFSPILTTTQFRALREVALTSASINSAGTEITNGTTVVTSCIDYRINVMDVATSFSYEEDDQTSVAHEATAVEQLRINATVSMVMTVNNDDAADGGTDDFVTGHQYARLMYVQLGTLELCMIVNIMSVTQGAASGGYRAEVLMRNAGAKHVRWVS